MFTLSSSCVYQHPRIHEKVLWGKDIVFTCKEAVQTCVNAGYKVLDMNFASYSRGTLPMTQPNWEYWVKDVKEFADSLGVEWQQAHAHFYRWIKASPEEKVWHEELIRRSIIGAGILEAKWLVIHPGTVYDDTWYSQAESLKANVEAFQRYAELASKYNVGIAIENMFEGQGYRRFGAPVDDLLELYEQLNDPETFGICWDTGHAHLQKINQAAALRRIGRRLKALHIADNKGEKDDHIAPYFGTIEWEPILRALKEIGYEGDFTLRSTTSPVWPTAA